MTDEPEAVNETAKEARAKETAAKLECDTIKWDARHSVSPDVLINCTPVGMHPNVNESPFQPQWLDDNTLVFDTVYNPENTLLIKQARERGCPTVSGIEMFIRQAALQYEQFTGRIAPLEIMRETLRRGISSVH